MNLLRSFADLPPAVLGGAVTIGNFDGVHRGHAQLVEQLCELAKQNSGPAVVFTFEPHPGVLLRPEAVPPPLSWLERKAALLGELGVDWVIAYPTDLKLLALEPREFFERIVRDGLQGRAMVEGPNFHFGRDRAGDIDTLKQYCQESAIRLEVAQPKADGNTLISSSRVRQAIGGGEISVANEMLGRPHRIRGEVVRGAERGRTIGFPTANLGRIDCLLPADGVYACRAIVPAGEFPAAVNIGPNPTFAEGERKVEAHLLDFEGDLYGQSIEIDFLDRLRGVVPFESIDALKQQLSNDCHATREIVGRTHNTENE